MRSWARAMAIAFLCAASALAQRPGQGANADIIGTWKIVRVAGFADSFGLTDRQIKALIGKPVLIGAEQFVFNGRTCAHPAYARTVEETRTYFRREWQADASRLPLPNPVTAIDTGCNMLYAMRKDHLIVAEDSGVFFEAQRVIDLR